jgi:hypothetical protein
MADQEHAVSLEDWLARLQQLLASERDVSLSEEERAALLDLARVAAHRSVRIAAPLSTFVAGIALADLPAPARTTSIRRLTSQLSAEAD